MAVTITYFSVLDFQAYVEQAIKETKGSLFAHIAQIEEIRKRYRKPEKLENKDDNNNSGPFWKKLIVGSGESKSDPFLPKETKKLEMNGFKVLINPTVEYELTLMEAAIASLEEKLDAFERAKELLGTLEKSENKICAVLTDGVPTGFMLYDKNYLLQA